MGNFDESGLHPWVSSDFCHCEVLMTVSELIVIHISGTVVQASFRVETRLSSSAVAAHWYFT